MLFGYARALGITHVPWYIFFIYIPVTFLLMAIPISVSGLGVGEAAYSYFFIQVGVLPEQAIMLPLMYRFGQMLISLVGGVLWFSAPPIEKEKLTEIESK
jgi:uncharacterized membrane protein YbhN (UPF0104 family)